MKQDDNSIFYQSHPFGYIPAFSGTGIIQSLSFMLDTDANLLLSLKDIKGGEMPTLFSISNLINKEVQDSLTGLYGIEIVFNGGSTARSSILEDGT